MTHSRVDLKKVIENYISEFPEERAFIPRFLELLDNENCFKRSNLEAHITGSAWIVSHDHSQVVLVHHRKLNRWLQPGGHADGNENILGVALKEANEETGIPEFGEVKNEVFDIDIHKIPARKEVSEHFHFDVRFLLLAKENTQIAANHESHEVRWINIAELHNFTGGHSSINRMVEKTKRMFCQK